MSIVDDDDLAELQEFLNLNYIRALLLGDSLTKTAI